MSHVYDQDPWLNAVKTQVTDLVAMQKRAENFSLQLQGHIQQQNRHHQKSMQGLQSVLSQLQTTLQTQQSLLDEAKTTLAAGKKHMQRRMAGLMLLTMVIPLAGLLGSYHYLGNAVIEEQQTLERLQQSRLQTPEVIEFEGKHWVKVQKGTEVMLQNGDEVAAYARLAASAP